MKRLTMLVIGTILILIILSCGLGGDLTPEEGFKAAPPSFESDSQGPQIASLDMLDSYRVHRTVWMVKENSSEEVNTTEAECVREPQAVHVAHHDPQMGLMERIAIGNTIWEKSVNGMWGQVISEQRVNDMIATMETFWGFSLLEPEEGIFLDAAILIDEKTVNGVHCKHYIVDTEKPTVHLEAWVADQSDLPPVLIRGLRHDISKDMTMYTEVNLTDINTPITIEPPE